MGPDRNTAITDYPRMVCGEDECVPPGKICNGKVECADNADEEPGLCNHL